MPDVISPKGNILAKRGKPTEEIHVNQKLILKKNIIPFCFSHLSHLSQGRTSDSHGNHICNVLTDNNAFCVID